MIVVRSESGNQGGCGYPILDPDSDSEKSYAKMITRCLEENREPAASEEQQCERVC